MTMTQLTKQQAAMLYAYDYKLVDKDGREYRIVSITESGLSLFVDYDSDWKPVLFSRIGTDYFILARPLSSLTTEIEHNGEKFVPIYVLNDSILFTKYTADFIEGVYYLLADYKKGVDVLYDFEKDLIAGWHFNLGFPEHTVKHLI